MSGVTVGFRPAIASDASVGFSGPETPGAAGRLPGSLVFAPLSTGREKARTGARIADGSSTGVPPTRTVEPAMGASGRAGAAGMIRASGGAVKVRTGPAGPAAGKDRRFVFSAAATSGACGRRGAGATGARCSGGGAKARTGCGAGVTATTLGKGSSFAERTSGAGVQIIWGGRSSSRCPATSVWLNLNRARGGRGSRGPAGVTSGSRLRRLYQTMRCSLGRISRSYSERRGSGGPLTVPKATHARIEP